MVTIAVLLWLPRLSGPIDLRWDAGVYYVLGTSLSSGQGYRIPSEPGSPEAVQYPPLLPAFIAAHQWFSATSDPAVVAPRLRVSYAILSVAFALAVLALAKKFLTTNAAVLVTALCLLHQLTIFLSDLLFAELPFALAGVIFAIVAISSPRSTFRELVSFVLATAAFLLKTMGIALFAAWVLDAFLRRRWKVVLVRSTLALLPVIAWQVHVTRVVHSREYTHPVYEYQRAAYQYSNVTYATNASLRHPFRPEQGTMNSTAWVERLTGNFPWLMMAVGETLSATAETWPLKSLQTRLWPRRLVRGNESPDAVSPVGAGIPEPSFIRTYLLIGIPLVALALLVGVGLVVLFRQESWLTFFIVVATLGLVWLTPWRPQFARYLMPLMPFLLICAALGFARIYGALKTGGHFRLVGRLILVSLLFLCCAIRILVPLKLFYLRGGRDGLFRGDEIGHTPRFFAHDRSWQDWEDAAAWIKTHALADAIVATSAPHLLYLLTGRLAVLPPMEIDRAREQHLLETVPVSYAIVDQLEALDVTRRYLGPSVSSSNDWRLVNTVHGTRIYQATEVTIPH